MWFALFDVTVLLVATVGILVEKNSKLKIKPLKKRADIQNGPLFDIIKMCTGRHQCTSTKERS